MSFKFGVYDLFSYTIPGVFYILFGLQLASFWGVYFLPSTSDMLASQNDMALIIYMIGLTVLAYVVGLLMDGITRSMWEPLFVRKDWRNDTIAYFKREYPNLKIKFNIEQTNVMFTIIRNKYPDTTGLMDWYRSIGINLRNTSFAFFLLFFNQIIAGLWPQFKPAYIVLALLLIFFSFIAMKYSREFNNNQFSLVCRAMMTECMDVSDFIEKKKRVLKSPQNPPQES